MHESVSLNKAIDQEAMRLILNHKDREVEALYKRVTSIHDRMDKLDESTDATAWINDALKGQTWGCIDDALTAWEEVISKLERQIDPDED